MRFQTEFAIANGCGEKSFWVPKEKILCQKMTRVRQFPGPMPMGADPASQARS
jgi:hypothetical protein